MSATMNLKPRFLALLLLASLLSALGGCYGFSSDANAILILRVKDTPVDGVQSVVVAFNRVELMPTSGKLQAFTFTVPQTVDLLNYQGDDSAVLINGRGIVGGSFDWVQLDIDTAHSYVIAANGNQYPLKLPSGSSGGLRITMPFTIAAGNTGDYVIDFNLRQALTESTGSGTPVYTLGPALRMVDASQTGSVSGTAVATLTVGGTAISASSCSPAIYVYAGTPTTLGGYAAAVSGGATPITSASLMLNTTTGDYNYFVAYLPAGSYTLAATCAGADSPGVTSLAFSASQTATVTVNGNATVMF